MTPAVVAQSHSRDFPSNMSQAIRPGRLSNYGRCQFPVVSGGGLLVVYGVVGVSACCMAGCRRPGLHLHRPAPMGLWGVWWETPPVRFRCFGQCRVPCPLLNLLPLRLLLPTQVPGRSKLPLNLPRRQPARISVSVFAPMPANRSMRAPCPFGRASDCPSTNSSDFR